MKTVGIDTNVLLSFRLKREPGFEVVKKIFQECLNKKIKIYIPLPVFLETEWVLRSFYGQPKEFIINFFEELMILTNLKIDKKENFKIVVNLYKNSNVSFTDCIIASEIKNQDCNEFLTFDENLKKIYYSLL